jgi:uncharacterized membrane protein
MKKLVTILFWTLIAILLFALVAIPAKEYQAAKAKLNLTVNENATINFVIGFILVAFIVIVMAFLLSPRPDHKIYPINKRMEIYDAENCLVDQWRRDEITDTEYYEEKSYLEAELKKVGG